MSYVPLPRCAGIGLVILSFAAGGAIAEEIKPRLKYRTKGPVCMCSSGLGEKEISSSLARAHLDRIQDTTQKNPSLSESDSTQPTRRNANEERK